MEIGRTTSQASPALSESSSQNSPGVNGVSVCDISGCNNVNNSGTVATSCIENLRRPLVLASTTSYLCLSLLIVHNK